MRQIREVLRLRAAGMSQREIATAARVGKTTVQETLIRADACALKWPLEEGMTDKELTEKLFPSFAGLSKGKALPDWSLVHQELKQKGVTLSPNRQNSNENLR